MYWLTAIASGPVAYARASRVLSHPSFNVLLAFGLVAFAYHFCNGIRHLLWDAGFGLERREARRSGWVVAVATVLIIVLVGCVVFIWSPGIL